MSSTQRLYARLLPHAGVGRREDWKRRAYLSISLSAISGVALLLSAGALLVQGSDLRLAAFPAGSGVLALGLPLLLLRTGSLALVAHTLVAIIFGGFVGMSLTSGGVGFGSTWALGVLPLLATLIAGWRAGVAWTLLAIAWLLALARMHALGFVFPGRLAPDDAHAAQLVGSVVLTLSLATIGILYERLKQDAIRGLEVANAALGAARQQAEAASRARGEFLANMSHEIRTPIGGVLGMTALLEDSPLGADQRTYVAAIRGATEGLLALLNDVLDMSKIEAGRMTFERTPFDLRQIAEEVVAMFAFQARQKSLALALHYPDGAPRGFLGDPVRVRQVLTNLVSNAVKFTAAGEVRIEVAASPAPDGRAAVALRVRDTGIGISTEQLPRLFESFVQADTSTTRRFGGTGLGLAISRSLVRGMGGTIEVDSVPERGSTFTVALRLVPSALPPAPKPTPQAPATRSLHVLVADDNEVNRTVACNLLERAGHRVTAVASGVEALTAAATERFDLVLMDCQMPGLDGYATARQLRAEGARMPIIALTANALEEDRARSRAAGMDDHALKPIRAEVLRALIDRHTGAREG